MSTESLCDTPLATEQSASAGAARAECGAETTTRRFHLVAAIDRHNYGDLLFPMVHSAFIRERYGAQTSIDYYAITAADMTAAGAYRTRSTETLLRGPLTEDDVIVFCGGDILSADWLLMVGHLSTPLMLKCARVARRLLGLPLTNHLVRRLAGKSAPFPYVFDSGASGAPVYFTAVGGAGFGGRGRVRHLSEVAQVLRRARAVSVRDAAARDLLQGAGVAARMVPDTALLMAEMFPREDLRARDWQRRILVNPGFDFDRYYSLQGARQYLNGRLDTLVSQVERIHARTGLGPLLVPIGRAPDHEDHVPLGQLFERLGRRGIPSAIQHSDHVLDIMASLAMARAYVGTSLHGAITSYAFGHKVCALYSNEVKKLRDFVQTWMQTGDYALFEHSEFADDFTELVADGDTIAAKAALAEQVAQVRETLAAYSDGR